MDFVEERFRRQIDICLEKVRQVLERNKNLSTPDLVSHRYEDKYLVADYLTNAAILSFINCIPKFGASEEQICKMIQWAHTSEVTFRFEARESCEFVKETKREEEDATKYKTELAGFTVSSITSKVIRTIKEYVFRYTCEYELVAVRGVGSSAEDRLVLQTRSASQEIVRPSKSSPYPESTIRHWQVSVSWLLRSVDPQSRQVLFSIDRSKASCHTPSRNGEVSEALSFFRKFREWTRQVDGFVRNELFAVQLTHSRLPTRPNVAAINSSDILIPVVPLVESRNEGDENDGDMRALLADREEDESAAATSVVTPPSPQPASTVALSGPVVMQLLGEQNRSVDAKCEQVMSALFPPGSECTAIVTAVEARLLVVVLHLGDVCAYYFDGIQFIENMIRKQLVAAVGKELQASDFAAYMRFHNRKIFREQFQPRPFSHAVRRSAQHSPEGSICIEESLSPGAAYEPIVTVAHETPSIQAPAMHFAINASTDVTFGGERHVHAWLNHSFSGQVAPKLRLVAQARQFSSFIVLVGRIASATVFEPKYGMIVQNKDEVVIPLLMEQIPTPKEFKDAIESLSPEQQRFAQAFRSMQLESTLFGVLVLQIKPQLEQVLKLNADSLTKEIKLTQDLMEMFIKYQIPSDLLSFDEQTSAGAACPGVETAASSTVRLQDVSEHVRAMQAMIAASKDKELEERVQEERYARPAAVLFDGFAVESMNSYGGGGGGGGGVSRGGVVSKGAPNRRLESAPMSTVGSIRRSACAAPPPPPPGAYSMSSAPPPAPPAPPAAMSVPSSAPTPLPAPGPHTVSQAAAKPPRDFKSAIEHEVGVVVDYTKIPVALDRKYEELDSDSCLRPTIINPGDEWTKKQTKSLLSPPVSTTLGAEELRAEKAAAFELLDALTRSGGLSLEGAALHVVIAATHCFDKSLLDTVVQGNVNPIERMERSTLIMATTLHELPASELVQQTQVGRISTYSPQLFE